MKRKLFQPRFGLFIAFLMLLSLPLSGAGNLFVGTSSGAGVAGSSHVPSAVGDWPMYGRDISRTNYNPDETSINAGNVNQLMQRWQVNIGSNGTPTSAAPSLADGILYVASSAASPSSNFFAFNAVSGSQVWAKSIGYRSSCFNVGIGSTPAISGTTIVVGADNANSNPAYYGLSTIDGSVIWTNTMSVGASGFPWASPLIYGNQTYTGISSRCDNPSVRGEIRNLDATSGTLTSNQYFVNAGEAGGGIWNSPAMSPDGSTIVVGTGEDYSCSACTYTRSMVSLDAGTLAILQHHQEPSPNQDLDFGTTPVVFHDSQNRTLVGAGHKNGIFYTYVLSNINAGAIWTRSGGTAVGLMPAYDPSFGSGGTLFVVNTSITAVDPSNGAVRWGPVSIPTSHGNIAIANGLLFVNVGSQGLQIRSETDGSLLRTLTPANAGANNSGVIVSNGFIYWLSGSYVNAWSFPSTGTTTPTPTLPPATSTPVPTSTLIPTSTRTATRTNTPVPPTSTFTTVPPTSTPQPTATSIPTSTATSIPTSTTIPSATPIPTSTGQPSATRTPTVAPTNTTSIIPTATRTSTTGVATSTRPPTQVATATSGVPSSTPTPGGPSPTAATETSTVEATAIATSTACTITFTDVPPDSPFYAYIRCLACRGIISGYGDGSFKPGNDITRGQIAKMVSNAAGFTEDPGPQVYEDVDSTNPFYQWINRLSNRGFIGGYPCGTIDPEPCVPPGNLPYFRTFADATRGQLSKIVANAAGIGGTPTGLYYTDVPEDNPFYLWIMRLTNIGVMSGYDCGGPGEPCDDQQRPYFRPFANVTRGQASKIVANTFFPDCQTPLARR